MRKGVSKHSRAILVAIVVPFAMLGFLGVRWAFDRTREFRAQAEAGQPIVSAIEKYRNEAGGYPESLADLSPQFLAAVPELPDPSQRKHTGWKYRTVNNGSSYSLRYFMGRGGVEYEPPHWIANDEGNRTILFSNK